MILLLACAIGGAPTWTPENVLAPHRARLDTNHDGRVTAEEYARVAWSAPPFATVDVDRDGDLSVAELQRLIESQNPNRFDAPAAPVDAGPGGNTRGAIDAGQRDVWEILVAMADELRKRGGPDVPPDLVAAAVGTGRMDSPETLRVLAILRPAWRANGWPWPFPEVP